MRFSAVVVSRMDYSLGPVIDSIARLADEIIVVRGHDGIWERWDAVTRAKHEMVYTQDDDAVVAVADVIAAYEPGLVTCNMPPAHRADYPDDIALVGWGCVFDRSLVWERRSASSEPQELDFMGAFEDYFDWCEEVGERRHLAHDAIFKRECDRVFTGLSRLKLIDVERTHLKQATHASRMGREPKHGACLQEIRRRINLVREWRAAK